MVLKASFTRKLSSLRRNKNEHEDTSASVHHKRSSTAHRKAGFRRMTSSLTWSRRASNTSEDSTHDEFFERMAIDPETQALAIGEANEVKAYFRESLPETLAEAHEARDCIAPFHRSEVRYTLYS